MSTQRDRWDAGRVVGASLEAETRGDDVGSGGSDGVVALGLSAVDALVAASACRVVWLAIEL